MSHRNVGNASILPALSQRRWFPDSLDAPTEVETPGGTDRFWFDAGFPHVLLKLETAAGRSLALRKTKRLDYWKHHAVGEEKLVE